MAVDVGIAGTHVAADRQPLDDVSGPVRVVGVANSLRGQFSLREDITVHIAFAAARRIAVAGGTAHALRHREIRLREHLATDQER